MVEGFEVTVRNENRGESRVTAITVAFPSTIGPSGLRFKRTRKHYRGRPSDGRRTRRGWYVYTGSDERRAVPGRSDDALALATWMTVDRTEALLDLAIRGRDVIVTREHVWTYVTEPLGPFTISAPSAAIVAEVRRVVPLARRLL